MIRLRTISGPFAAFILFGLFGCQAETFGGEDLPIDPGQLVVVAGVPLAGSFITISAPWMSAMADTMSIALDDRPATLAVRVSGQQDRFLVLLPATLPPGTHQLLLQRASHDRLPIGQLQTGGFSEIRMAAGSDLSPTQPDPYLPGIFAEGGVPGIPGCQVVAVDARRATVSRVTDGAYCGYGIGASYRSTSFLVYRPWSGGYWLSIGYALGHTIPDSLVVWGNWWPTHELAPGLYLQDTKYETDLVDVTNGTSTALDNGGYGHPQRIAFSDDGAWAVSSHSRSIDGLLIVDRQARTYNWSPGWALYAFPLFQADGRLVAYGWRAKTPGAVYQEEYQEVLAHVDVVTGAMIDSVVFGQAGSPYDLPVALSANGWIVFPGWVGDHLELSIRDPITLAEVAHPASLAFANTCWWYSTYSVVEDAPLHRFYIVGNDCNGSIPIATFELPE